MTGGDIHPCPQLAICLVSWISARGTTAEKLRGVGDQCLGQKTGALAPRALPQAGLEEDAGGGCPPAVGVRWYNSEKSVKTQMLNCACS